MAEKKKRVRRTADQLISDLQARIEHLKKRSQARRAKTSPSLKNTADAVRHIDTALKSVEDPSLKKSLQEAREPLAAYLAMEGIPIPKPRGRKLGAVVPRGSPRKREMQAELQAAS